MLSPFAKDLWLAEGTCVSTAGFAYPTRAIMIRLPDDGVLVWSPVKLTPELQEAVSDLGPVKYLIAPNTLHHLFVQDWLDTFPDAQLYGPAGLARKRSDLRFAGVIENGAKMPWGDALLHRVVPHMIATEAVFFHPSSATVIFTDLIQHFSRGWHKGWRARIAQMDRMVGDEPQVPRKFRLGFGRRSKARLAMKPILDWPTERVLMAHGDPVTKDGQVMLRRAFDWLF